MASGGFQIFLFLFILGSTMGVVDQLGIFQVHYATPGYEIQMETLSDAHNAALDSPLSIFVVYIWVVAFLKIIVSGLLAVISFAGLLYALGWPMDTTGALLIQLVQTPATLIAFMWIYELWTGRIIG